MAASNFQAFPVVDGNNRTIGVLSKSDFLKTVNRKLILVDHNELSQAVHLARTRWRFWRSSITTASAR